MRKKCPECHGDGKLEWVSTCPNCDGTGYLIVKFKITRMKSEEYLPTPWMVEAPDGCIFWEASHATAIAHMDVIAPAVFVRLAAFA